jgi:hypothetical protein
VRAGPVRRILSRLAGPSVRCGVCAVFLGPVVADGLGAHAVRSSDGFDVTNPVDGTRYQVRPTSISIRSPGGQVSTEPMIQYAARRPFLTAAVLIIIAFVIAVCIFIWVAATR